MSAFIVDKAHIDALVTLAVYGPGHPDQSHMNWYGVTWLEARGENPIDNRWTKADHSNADKIGAMLWAENVASIHGRYPDTEETHENYPGPNDFDPFDTLRYSWPMRSRRLTAVEGLKALSCYEYQSCEHDGWEASEAKRFCEALRDNLIPCLPGYEAAEWEVSAA